MVRIIEQVVDEKVVGQDDSMTKHDLFDGKGAPSIGTVEADGWRGFERGHCGDAVGGGRRETCKVWKVSDCTIFV